MMKLEGFDTGRVAAIDAGATLCCYECGFTFATSFAQGPAKRLSSPSAPLGRQIQRLAERELGCVVPAEWRAFKTEAPPVQRPKLPLNHHLRRKLTLTSLALEQA